MQVVVFPLNGKLRWPESISNFAQQINMSSIKYVKTVGMITGPITQEGFVFKVEEGMPKGQFLELISFDGDAYLLSDTRISEYK
jgi:hypothetical protein